MSSIETDAAAIFFANLLLPMRRANIRKGVNYLDYGEPRESYWRQVASRTGGMEALPAGCDVGSLLGLLREYWMQRNDTALLLLLPHLESLHQELTAVAATTGNEATDAFLTEFAYPLS